MNAQNLLDKYIKYDSKITFDIFKLMYQKLNDLGFTSPNNVEEAFKEFSNDYPYFVMKLYSDKPYFNQYSCNLIEQSEISVEDILGYNPFENFILPEKWCIKVEKNAEIINKWKQTTEWTATASNYRYVSYKGDGYTSKTCHPEYSEITIEQFKQHVLGKITKGNGILDSVEKDWSKATEEEILTEAKRKYPIGTKYRGVCDKHIEGVVNQNYDVRKPFNNDEIVLDAGKDYLFFNNRWAEIISLPETKLKEDAPEYVECIYSATDVFILGKIYKCIEGSTYTDLYLNSENGKKDSLPYDGRLWKFKPSTKEAFEEQNKPKSIEKWGVGSYIVPLQNKLLTRDEPLIKGKPYQITKRSSVPYIMCEKGMEINFCDDSYTEPREGIKWFATLTEAEEFAKTLKSETTEFPKEGCCETKSNELEQYLIKTEHKSDFKTTKSEATGIGWNENSYWWIVNINKSSKTKYELSYLETWIDKPQLTKTVQDLKAVHCTTQEEWDFACDKYNKDFPKKDFPNYNTFNYTNSFAGWHNLEYFEALGYQILSFQEWCDLNSYNMVSFKYKKGDCYVVTKECSGRYGTLNFCYKALIDHNSAIYFETGACISTDCTLIRPATLEEIEEYKRIGKPYDVTTLQTPEISTYGLNVGDKLDAKIITAWEKQGFNYFSDRSEMWVFGNGSAYDGNRKIENFKVIDGVVGFLVSGTLKIYLRAEGFKEFADNYNKPKESMVKFEIDKWCKVCNGNFNIPHDDLYYVKSPKIINDIIAVDQYLHNGYLGKGGNFGRVGDYTFVEVPLSEIQHLLPEGHPDLVNTVNKEVKDISKTFTIRVTSREVKRINI